MIVIKNGILFIDREDMFIGHIGDNLHTVKQFIVENETDENCTYRLFLSFGKDERGNEITNHLVLDSKVENSSTILNWTISTDHIFKSGLVKAQVKAFKNEYEIMHTTHNYFFVNDSAEFSEDYSEKNNAEFLEYEKALNEIREKIAANSFDLVPKSRSIAGLSLSEDILNDELCESLGIFPPTYKSKPPESFDGDESRFWVDTTENDLYFCIGRTLSGYNWIKLSGNEDTNGNDTVGIKSITQGSQSSYDEGVNTLEVVLTDGTTTSFIVRNGSKGEQGPAGETGPIGPQGPQGEAGKAGANGQDGETPIVTLTEVTGGYKITIETEEKTQQAIIKNGTDGKTPVVGIDYFTESDKADIVQAVIESFGGNPVSGYVDEENNIIVTGNLSNGIYNIKYELEDGTTIDIGELTLTDDDTEKPAYTNLAQPNADNTTDFTIWCNNARVGSDGTVSTRDGYTVTNFFTLTSRDVLRVKNFKVERLCLYDAEKNPLPNGVGVVADVATNGYIESDYTLTDTDLICTAKSDTIVYTRLSGTLTNTANDVIITKNEEIA
ncbi:MAG: collagen-like protein [Ruminococcus sp.]|nr:collagen-like protein [Ruminococcus sp.]